MNPAVECSRGLYPQELDSDDCFLRGPCFLGLSSDEWPIAVHTQDLPETEQEWIGFLTIDDFTGPMGELIARSRIFISRSRLHHL